MAGNKTHSTGLSKSRLALLKELGPMMRAPQGQEREIAARISRLADLTEAVLRQERNFANSMLPARLHEAALIHFVLGKDIQSANREGSISNFVLEQAVLEHIGGVSHTNVIDLLRAQQGLDLDNTLGRGRIEETKGEKGEIALLLRELFQDITQTEILPLLRRESQDKTKV